jgi:pyrroline-5-carboxylate reductase
MTEVSKILTPTWMIGCGNMGGAMIDGWRLAETNFANFVVIRPSGVAVDGVRTVKTPAEAGSPPKLVILAFKPQNLDEVAAQLKPWLTSKTVVVSILAGVEVATLRARFPGVRSVVRAMPNLPVAIRRGVVALYSEDADEALRLELAELFVLLGFTPWMADEAKFAAAGAVAGAGPAYVARFIDALSKAGQDRGLSEQIASIVARETVLGTAWLSASTGEDMAALAKRVASPKGTTEAGLKVLDHDKVLEQLVALTIEAAAARGAEIAEEAKSKAGAALEDASQPS